jgi:hypothetical protein
VPKRNRGTILSPVLEKVTRGRESANQKVREKMYVCARKKGRENKLSQVQYILDKVRGEFVSKPN